MKVLRLARGTRWVRDERRVIVVNEVKGLSLILTDAEAYAWELWADGCRPDVIRERLERTWASGSEEARAAWRAMIDRLISHGLVEASQK